jgi:biotin synthesis protein BioG
MKQCFINHKGSARLLLFFAGWGMDEHPFAGLRKAGSDCMICYDYRTLEFDVAQLATYTDITVIGWSMGVWAASQTLKQHPELPVTRRIAINGTLYPVDETRGIAPAIFDGTLQGLNEQTLQKFRRRMCGSTAWFQAFQSVAPQRSVEELKEELAAIGTQYRQLNPVETPWDKAIIGTEDRIFPADNQRRAWQGALVAVVEEVEAPHCSREIFLQLRRNAYE